VELPDALESIRIERFGVFGNRRMNVLGFDILGLVAGLYADLVLYVRHGLLYDGFCAFRFHDNTFQYN
jgi:hypothetical protein